MNINIITAIIAASTSLLVALITSFFAISKIRREKVELFKIEHIKNMIFSYRKLWSILKPLSRIHYENTSIIIKENDEYFVVRDHVIKFYQRFSDFFFSDEGLYLSRNLRQELFAVRDKLFDTLEKEDGKMIKISSTKARKLYDQFDWILTIIRNDIGIRDILIPKGELGLKDRI